MKKFRNPIYVTRPFLPSLEEFQNGCKEIWHNQWLTNNGPILQSFQKELAQYLDVSEDNLVLFNNGTLALELAYYAMGLAGGDVITTPFTFVATSHALKRIGATPIFADIDPVTMCLDPAKCEKLITPRTKAIVPVHVYGHACDVKGFARLGKKYGVKIIYDAAHAFGVNLDGMSIAHYGDMSMFSLHPTKLLHSCEGGLLVFKDKSLKLRLEELRNFAIKSETECVDIGTNAKMNELQALMGRLCLRNCKKLLDWRRKVYEAYAKSFSGCKQVSFPNPRACEPGLIPNHAYCPILFNCQETCERVYLELKKHNVFARRYFYPLLTQFPPYIYARNTCAVAEDISSRILTLPTYYGLSLDKVQKIASIIKNLL